MNGYFTTSGKPLTGEIRGGLFSSSSLPAGWLVCDGSELDAVKYPRLAALITAADDGKKYLPNLQDGVLRGAGLSVKGCLLGENTPIVPVAQHSHKFLYSEMGSGTQSGQVIDSAEGNFIVASETSNSSSTEINYPRLNKNWFVDALGEGKTGLSLSSAGNPSASLDVRGKSLYVNFIIYAL